MSGKKQAKKNVTNNTNIRDSKNAGDSKDVIDSKNAGDNKDVADGKKGKNGEKGEFNLKSEILGWVEVIVIAVVLALVIDSFIIINATIPSGSMEKTIMTGDRVLGLRFVYWFNDPKRGDIVVFKYPVDGFLPCCNVSFT